MEMQAENIEVKKQIWKDHLSGEEYSDPLDILYYKNTLNEEKYSNLLLGSFNAEGNYSIEKELLQELINVNKFITDNVEGVYHLTAKTTSPEFDLHFLLKIKNDDENNKKIASLILLEPFKGLDEQTLSEFATTIARYRDENDIYFMPKVAKVFHIFDKRDEDGRESENDEILLNVLKSKKQLKMLKNKLAESNEYLSQYYIDNVIAILKKYPGKYSEYILRKYDMLLLEHKGNLNKKNYYKMLRLELDKLLMASRHMCDNPDLLKALGEQKQIFVNNMDKFEETLKAPPIAAPKKEEAKKSAAKAAPAKKAAAKKKSAAKKKAAPAKKKVAPQFKWLVEREEPTLPPVIPEAKQETQTEKQDNKSIIIPPGLFLDSMLDDNINVPPAISDNFISEKNKTTFVNISELTNAEFDM